ncbi:hypothetical protein CVU83_00755 [Candidatus Falkowbacteria bacterium HGW-Falkowbacteria-2]|uniref:Uncharacterized protein n=1 Tax=Candidatus Falkowbacteria bacterium HGW-Falkowbacteria-2 TaxID=2013769 RepID=A0A2N2E2U4_9BACT|nr:MAG: hypothetical protein CVU83_00755 [Candidatus Falkowbacteria bacterium HGW-Falkowbacteria-2]
MNYIAQCLQKFSKLPPDLKEILGGPDALVAVKEIELEYGVNTSFVLILVGIGELKPTQVADYLMREESLSEEDALEVSRALARTVFSQLVASVAPAQEVVSPEDLKEELKNDLLKLISDKELAESFNLDVFLLLKNEPTFLSELEMIITNNPTIVSKSKITDEKGSHQPTVANWIKDFVALNGSGNFDDLVLANYISNSKNTKTLSAAEKILLSRVFKVYRNITHFDEITDKTPVKFWSIIPTDIEAEAPVSQPVIQEKKASLKEAKAEEPVVIKNDSDAAKLQAALNDYAVGSLEYKVIKQELDRLRQTVSAR